MKKVIKTLIMSLLVVVTLMTASVSTISAEETNPTTTGSTFKGTHILTAPEVADEDYILRNGEFYYILVYPANATSREVLAKDEFNRLLKRATGLTAAAMTDAEITAYNPDTKYISIGQTKLLDLAGITINRAALKTNGVRIITKDKNIFLAGGVADGAIHAVYDFFQICFNFEWYSRNNVYIDDTITTVKLRNFDVTDIPDINTLSIMYSPLGKSSDELLPSDRMGLTSKYITSDTDLIDELNNKSSRSRYSKPGRSILMTVNGRKVLGKNESTNASQHTVLTMFNKYEMNKVNNQLVLNEEWESNWWATSENQLCWTARGDEGSYQRMIDYGVKRVIEHLQTYSLTAFPEANSIMFGVEDGGQACRCDECEYRLEQDGTRSGASIRFVRQVYDKVREWLDDPANAQYYREDFKFVIFAYGEVKQAPAHKDANGQWVVNEGLYEGMEEYRGRMFDDIVVWKTFGGPEYLDVYSDAPDVADTVEEYKAWGATSDGVFAWNYAELYLDSPYFQDFLSRWNTNLIEFYDSLNIENVLIELGGTGGTYNACPRWGDLYYYVITKLAWDGSQSTTKLITKFMQAQFGPAAKTMEDLYYAQKRHFQSEAEKFYASKGYYFDIGYKSWSQEQYPIELLKSFVGYIDQAYEDIKDLEFTNPNLYGAIKERIDVEGVAFYYIIMKLYSGETGELKYSAEEKAIYKARGLAISTTRTIKGITDKTFTAW